MGKGIKLSQYLMACGHHGHKRDRNGNPMCIFCPPPESRTVVAIEPEGSRRSGRDLFGEEW